MEIDRKQQEKNTRRKILIWVSGFLLVAAIVTAGLLNYYRPFRSAFLSAAEVAPRGEGEMRFHFLDVGQADCTIVEFPSGETLVVDAGAADRASEDKIASYLMGLGSPRITIVLTHADLDHFGGFPYLLECFEAEKVYLPQIATEGMEYTEFLRAVEEEGCPKEFLSRYDTFGDSAGGYGVCLSPYSMEETDGNDASAVLYFEYMGVRAVLAADISADRERRLVSEYGLMDGIFDNRDYHVRLEGTQILKAAHHGSAGSSSSEWLSLLSPKETVISCGKGNPYDHPAPDLLTRLAAVGSNVYRTDLSGDVMLTISSDGAYRFTSPTLEPL